MYNPVDDPELESAWFQTVESSKFCNQFCTVTKVCTATKFAALKCNSYRYNPDAFPNDVAEKKGYQRRATVLIYLNDVAEVGGGVT
jgi:hypothetical protein